MQEKKVILLVDDNDFYNTNAELILKNTYEIIVAKSGMEAVEYFLDGIGRIPDLILLDIVMPDMDGWLTYNRLRQIDSAKNIPIAIVTAVSGSSVENHAQNVGVADFISKPYDKKDLLERVNRILNQGGIL